MIKLGMIDATRIKNNREGSLSELWIPYWHSNHTTSGNNPVEMEYGNLVGPHQRPIVEASRRLSEKVLICSSTFYRGMHLLVRSLLIVYWVMRTRVVMTSMKWSVSLLFHIYWYNRITILLKRFKLIFRIANCRGSLLHWGNLFANFFLIRV